MREVRLRFSKTGNIKYISHLDINRAIGRAFKRADIPLWYTEGFNPHPYMSFSLPLSLGIESLCESVDIRLLEDISNEEIKSRMNDVLPDGLKIIDAYDDFGDCKEIEYSDYVFKFRFDDNEKAMQRIKNVLDAENIPALKKSKQGRRKIFKETNIKEFIVKYNISVRDDEVVLNIRLAAGNNRNLNPSLLCETILRLIEMDFLWKSISRISLLDKNFKEFR